MGYEKKNDLPNTLRETLPEPAQEIYIEAYNRALEEYEEKKGGEAGREAVAHRDAMHAVKREFVHKSETGQWYRKGEEPKEEEGEEGLVDQIKGKIEELT